MRLLPPLRLSSSRSIADHRRRRRRRRHGAQSGARRLGDWQSLPADYQRYEGECGNAPSPVYNVTSHNCNSRFRMPDPFGRISSPKPANCTPAFGKSSVQLHLHAMPSQVINCCANVMLSIPERPFRRYRRIWMCSRKSPMRPPTRKVRVSLFVPMPGSWHW